MAFKLIIATGFYAAAMFPQISQQPPMTGSFKLSEKFETEQTCVDAAISMNKDFARDWETAEKVVNEARDPPFAAVVARRGSHKNNMDRLTQKDWDEIRAERKKIMDAMPPIPLAVAFCVSTDLFAN